MAKVFAYRSGYEVQYGVAKNAEEAYENRVAIDEKFHYSPCEIEELVIDGYTIEAKPKSKRSAQDEE